MPKGESNKFVYDTSPETGKPLTTHQWYDGTQHPWEFKRVWHLEPSLTDPDTVYAGVEDAALFRIDRRRQDLARARRPARPRHGPAMGSPAPAAWACTRSCSIPTNPNRIYIAISAAGAFRTDDGGKTWKPINRGLQLAVHPRPDAEVGHCVHRIAHAPVAPGHALHAEALGRDAHRQRRRQMARGQRQPADRFRLPDRRPRPRAGDGLRRADQERLASTIRPKASSASTAAAPAATSGSRSPKACRRENCYVNVLRDAMASTRSTRAASTSAPPAARSTARADGGDNWTPIVRDLPAVLSVEVQTLP